MLFALGFLAGIILGMILSGFICTSLHGEDDE